MKAARIARFGPPDVVSIDDVAAPSPGEGQLLVRVKAAGVGPWDALIREGKSVIAQSLPLTLGSDVSGVVEGIGPGAPDFAIGDEVFGVTNEQFTGAYAEYAVCSAKMMAAKPVSLGFVEAASAPVVAVTAWQMLLDYARLKAGQTVLIHGAAGNVGYYAVQLAKTAGARVVATAAGAGLEYLRRLGVDIAIDYRSQRFEDVSGPVDAVIDTVGGETQKRSFSVLKNDGILVSVASLIPKEIKRQFGDRAVFFLVEVTNARLHAIAQRFDAGTLVTHVGTVLTLNEARQAHEMLAGAPHKAGKIVLRIAS